MNKYDLITEFNLDWDYAKNGHLIRSGPFIIKIISDNHYAIDMKVPNLGLISIGDRKTLNGAQDLCKQIMNAIVAGCKFESYSQYSE